MGPCVPDDLQIQKLFKLASHVNEQCSRYGTYIINTHKHYTAGSEKGFLSEQ